MNTKTRNSHKPSADEIEARKAQRAERVAALESAVEAFDLDDASAATMRAYDELCTHYSEGNALLILAQAMDQGLRVRRLSDVGAFGTFKAAGRMVKKDEHASIFIWAPAGSAAQADKVETPPQEATTDSKSTRKFFRLAPLFHISQTEEMAAGCPDCGEAGERKGHMECQYPKD